MWKMFRRGNKPWCRFQIYCSCTELPAKWNGQRNWKYSAVCSNAPSNTDIVIVNVTWINIPAWTADGTWQWGRYCIGYGRNCIKSWRLRNRHVNWIVRRCESTYQNEICRKVEMINKWNENDSFEKKENNEFSENVQSRAQFRPLKAHPSLLNDAGFAKVMYYMM